MTQREKLLYSLMMLKISYYNVHAESVHDSEEEIAYAKGKASGMEAAIEILINHDFLPCIITSEESCS